MELFEYRSTYNINTNGLFNANTEESSDLGGLCVRLKNLMTSELHLKWDVALFDQYLADSMVPRSLRWEMSPQQDELLLEEWFTFFNKAGLSLVQFLRKRKMDKLKSLDSQIQEMKEKLSVYKDSEEFKEKSSSLKKTLEKEDNDQRIKKKKKFARDYSDYRAGLVFNWQKKLASGPAMETGHQTNPPLESTTITDPKGPGKSTKPKTKGKKGTHPTKNDGKNNYPKGPPDHSQGGFDPLRECEPQPPSWYEGQAPSSPYAYSHWREPRREFRTPPPFRGRYYNEYSRSRERTVPYSPGYYREWAPSNRRPYRQESWRHGESGGSRGPAPPYYGGTENSGPNRITPGPTSLIWVSNKVLGVFPS